MTTDTLTISRIHHADPRLAALTYPRWRKFFTVAGSAPPAPLAPGIVVFAAWDDGQPVGLALGYQNETHEMARLCSIYVLPAYRQRGIAGELLAATEAALQAEGRQSIVALHTDTMPGRTAFEALLQRSGWPAPQLYRVRLSGRADWVVSAEQEWAPWLARLKKRGWSATRWDSLNADELAELDRVAAEAPAVLRPLKERRYEPSSLVLRRDDAIVGWIQAVEEAQPGHILYPVGYVIPELQRTPWLVAGLVAACRRQMDNLWGNSVCHYETAGDNMAMQAIMLKRLADRPGLLDIDRQFESIKPLACA